KRIPRGQRSHARRPLEYGAEVAGAAGKRRSVHAAVEAQGERTLRPRSIVRRAGELVQHRQRRSRRSEAEEGAASPAVICSAVNRTVGALNQSSERTV